GIQKNQLAQDDFMFDSVEGGAFVPDPSITTEGSALLFPENEQDLVHSNSGRPDPKCGGEPEQLLFVVDDRKQTFDFAPILAVAMNPTGQRGDGD
ncbi:hypothetical protein KXV85_011090, partial [Aspergillus fumigatus]